MAIYLKITGAGNDESALGDCGDRYCLDGAFQVGNVFFLLSFHSDLHVAAFRYDFVQRGAI